VDIREFYVDLNRTQDAALRRRSEVKCDAMGRKSSAKMQGRDSSSNDATPPSGGSSTLLTVVVIGALLAAVGGFAYVKAGRDNAVPAMTMDHSAHGGDMQAAGEPRWATLGPHKQAVLPPLPTQEYAPPRPPDVVRAAYLFAAEHPEILSYVPCFCGCERGGHKGNEDCFVSARAQNGDVTAWEPHGLECTVCIDVATEARQMYTSGATVRDIRAAIEKKWAGFNGGHTPTPPAPTKSNE